MNIVYNCIIHSLLSVLVIHYSLFIAVWQVLALVQKLLLEGKVATQREAYYCLVQHFKNQTEFNDTLQGISLLFINMLLI